jgi:hypothetical protein
MVPSQIIANPVIVSERCEVFVEVNGWFIRSADGESIGPFAAMRDVEDWLDAHDHLQSPTDPPR